MAENGWYIFGRNLTDAAGRLTQVVDSATAPATTETYTWNNDGTLARYPGLAGSGYTRVLSYDEEQHLTAIAHDFGGGNIVNAYAYGYAADGGRRWRKDYANNVWTWYPCGVACNAGELVEQTSNLAGSTWTTSALYLKGGTGCGVQIVRRNNEYHYGDILRNYSVVADGTSTIVCSSLYDYFAVPRYITGQAQTPWQRQNLSLEEDNLTTFNNIDRLSQRGGITTQQAKPPTPFSQLSWWNPLRCTNTMDVNCKLKCLSHGCLRHTCFRVWPIPICYCDGCVPQSPWIEPFPGAWDIWD